MGVSTEDKSVDTKNTFYEEIELVFSQFHKQMNIFFYKIAMQLPIDNESLHENSNDNVMRLVNFAM